MRAKYTKPLKQIQSLESALQDIDRFGPSTVAAYRRALSGAKDCLYGLGDIDKPIDVPQFLRLEDDVLGLIRQLNQAITQKTERFTEAAIISSEDLLSKVQKWYQEEKNNRKDAELLKEEIKQLKSELFDYRTELAEMQEKSKAANEVVDNIANIDTANEWAEDYRQYVEYDDATLKEINRNIERLKKQKSGSQFGRWCDVQAHKSKRFLIDLFKNRLFYSGQSYNNSTRKWSAWRTVWLLGFLGVAIIYVSTTWGLPITDMWYKELLITKIKFLPLIIILAIGFTFSSRNLKICQHLLEQYRHRYNVARTMQNLISRKVIKNEPGLLEQGLKVLFEFRNAGYMNKNESDGSRFDELIKITGPK